MSCIGGEGGAHINVQISFAFGCRSTLARVLQRLRGFPEDALMLMFLIKCMGALTEYRKFKLSKLFKNHSPDAALKCTHWLVLLKYTVGIIMPNDTNIPKVIKKVFNWTTWHKKLQEELAWVNTDAFWLNKYLVFLSAANLDRPISIYVYICKHFSVEGCINNGNTANPFRVCCTGKGERGLLAKVDKTKQPK